jgi:putative salt-induced outer membrane protein YdiY
MQQNRRRKRRSNAWQTRALLLSLALIVAPAIRAEKVILHLKNGDRISGEIAGETTQAVTISSPFYGSVQVPVAEISRREAVSAPPAVVTNAPAIQAFPTNNVPAGTNTASKAGPSVAPAPAKKAAEPMSPANPEATPIAATPSMWKHDIRFGLNLRYSTRDSQEFSVIAKSTYAKAPFRHIFDGNFRYGRLDGRLAAHTLTGSEKTEYKLSDRTYLFSLIGGGYDEIRNIDLQFEMGPGFGMELLRKTNFVWKGEIGFNYQRQYRSDDTINNVYSIRIAEIFAWRIWDKLTADAKFEVYPSLDEPGEYRFRLESTLRYPVSKLLSLNLDVINLYDSEPAKGIPANDLQIRSSIGVTF